MDLKIIKHIALLNDLFMRHLWDGFFHMGQGDFFKNLFSITNSQSP